MKKRILGAVCLAVLLALTGCTTSRQQYINELLDKIDQLEHQIDCLNGDHENCGTVEYVWLGGSRCSATATCTHCGETFSQIVDATVSDETVTAVFENTSLGTCTQNICNYEQQENTWQVWTLEALRSAVAQAVQANGAVQLMANISLDAETENSDGTCGLVIPGSMTLDLNGCVLSSQEDTVISIYAGEEGNVTIIDNATEKGCLIGTDGTSSVIVVSSCGKLTLEDCAVQVEGSSVCAVYAYDGQVVLNNAYVMVVGAVDADQVSVSCGVLGAGDVMVNSSYIEVHKGDLAYGISSTGGQIVLNDSNVTMLGGNVAYGVFADGDDTQISGADISVDATVACGIYSTSHVAVENSTLDICGTNTTYGIYATGNVDFSDSSLSAFAKTSFGIYVDAAEVIVSGGQIQSSGVTVAGILGNRSIVTVLSGTIFAETEDSDSGYADGIEVWSYEENDAALNVSGGKIDGDTDALYFYSATGTVPSVTITGGTINGMVYLSGVQYTLDQFLEVIGQ